MDPNNSIVIEVNHKKAGKTSTKSVCLLQRERNATAE